MSEQARKTPEEAPETEKVPSLWAKKKKGEDRKLRPLYVLAMRLTAEMTQEEASKVVYVSVRTWRKWEGEEGTQNHRYPREAFVELFCRKRGLVFPPKFNLIKVVEKEAVEVDKGGQ